VSHPLDAQILSCLTTAGEQSAAGIAAAIGAGPEAVTARLAELSYQGMAVRETHRRGTPDTWRPGLPVTATHLIATRGGLIRASRGATPTGPVEVTDLYHETHGDDGMLTGWTFRLRLIFLDGKPAGSAEGAADQAGIGDPPQQIRPEDVAGRWAPPQLPRS